MRLRFLFRGEEARALQHNVYADLCPGQVFRILFGQDLDPLAIDGDGSFIGFNGVALVTALRGVIFQQVRQHLRAGEVVDRDDLVAFRAEHLTERQTADPAKTIDRNFYCHNSTSSFYSGMRFFGRIKGLGEPPCGSASRQGFGKAVPAASPDAHCE